LSAGCCLLQVDVVIEPLVASVPAAAARPCKTSRTRAALLLPDDKLADVSVLLRYCRAPVSTAPYAEFRSFLRCRCGTAAKSPRHPRGARDAAASSGTPSRSSERLAYRQTPLPPAEGCSRIGELLGAGLPSEATAIVCVAIGADSATTVMAKLSTLPP
jgi:hypothetical protein